MRHLEKNFRVLEGAVPYHGAMGFLDRAVVFSLSRLPPARAHDWACGALRLASSRRWALRLLRRLFAPREALPCQRLGLEFPSILGLASGFDRDASLLPALGALGFGHLEVGSLSSSCHRATPDPNLFLDRSQKALGYGQTRGMPGDSQVLAQLSRAYAACPKGASLAFPETMDRSSRDDFFALAVRISRSADFLTLVPAPFSAFGESPWLHPVRLGKALRELAPHLECPLLVKLPPATLAGPLLELAQASLESGAQGWVLGGGIPKSQVPPLKRRGNPDGWVTGRPATLPTLQAVEAVRRRFGLGPLVVASGGILEGADVLRAVRRGADLVQIYSALVLRGPSVVSQLTRETQREMRRLGIPHLEDLRGVDL